LNDIVRQRGEVYGHPQKNFKRIAHLVKVLDECPDDIVRHILYMILVKVSRLVESPEHRDSWDDIIGYVETAFLALGKDNGRAK
jgi:hypothetical protein|tara:strand:- start:11156 stop:11407 length:252 start_codon:yes stop_codon:yes gene_type:complete